MDKYTRTNNGIIIQTGKFYPKEGKDSKSVDGNGDNDDYSDNKTGRSVRLLLRRCERDKRRPTS